MTKALSVAQVVAAEAVSGTPAERYADMKAIASVIANRAAMLGVSPEDVVSVTSQFNAYNRQMPPGTASLVDMAQAAINDVAQNGPVSAATYYSTPATQDNLPSGLQPVDQTSGHIFQIDPAMRAIITAQGPIRPDPNALPSVASLDPLQQALQAPYEANGLLNGVTSLTPAPATAVTSTNVPAGQLDPAFAPNGLLSGNFPASSFQAPASAPMGALATGDYSTPNFSPSLNNFASLAGAGVPGGQVATPNERMGLASADFDPSRFAGPTPSTALAQVMQTPTAYLDAPEPHPNINNFGLLAGAQPVQSPMDVQGVLGAMKQPNLTASTSVPFASMLFSPAISTPTVNSFADLAAAQPVSSPMNVSATSVPSQSPIAGQEGINSPEMQAMDANVEQQLAAARPMSSPVTAQPTGILGTTPGLAANAVATPANAGLLSGYQPTQTNTPAENAINAVSPQNVDPSIAGYQQMASTALPGGITNLSGNTLVGPTGVATSTVPNFSAPVSNYVANSMATQALSPSVPSLASSSLLSAPASVQSVVNPTTIPGASIPSVNAPSLPSSVLSSPVNIAEDPAVSLPSLPTVSVPDQPTVAAPTDTTQSNVTIAGPTTAAVTTAQQPALTGSFPAAPAKPGLLSGLLNKQTLAGGILGSLVAGPAGALVGGLLGNAINKSGGLTGLLSGSPMSVNNIGGGLTNVQSVYNGATPGTQATSNDGGQVTSLGGGWTAVTGPSGVTTSFGPNGQVASYFGPSVTGTDHGVDTSGFSPGLW